MVGSEMYPIRRILDMLKWDMLIRALIIQVVSFAKVIVGFECINSGDNNLSKSTLNATSKRKYLLWTNSLS